MTNHYYLVTTVQEFSKALTLSNGQPLNLVGSWPRYFCAVFTNYREALAWANGKAELVVRVERAKP